MSDATDRPEREESGLEGSEELVPVEGTGERLSIKDIGPVKLKVSAELGSCPMIVRDVLALKRGSVLPLDKLAGEMTDIYMGGILFARGEVVVLGDSLHVRIAEICGVEEIEAASDE